MGFKLFSLWGEVDANTTPAEKKIAALQAQVARLQGRFDAVGDRGGAGFGRVGRLVNGVANGLRSATTGGRGLYGVLTAAAATAGAFTVLHKAVSGASDLYESLSKVRTTFRGSADEVIAGADEMGRKFGIVNQTFLDSASNLGLIAKASGLSEDAAAKLSVKMTKLALDVSSFFNTSTEEAFIAFRAGLVGESEPMRRFGVLLSEAAVQNEALALGLVRSKKELTDGIKVQARASIMIRQLADAQGDLQRTSGGFANSWRALMGRITNTVTKFGEKILPIFQEFVRVAGIFLEKLGDYLERNSAQIKEWSNNVAIAIGRFSTFFANPAEFAKWGLFAALDRAQKMFAGLFEAAGWAWGKIKEGASAMADFVGNLFVNLGKIIRNVFVGVEKWVSSFLDSLAGAISVSLQNAIIDFAGTKAADWIAMIPGMAANAAALKAIAKTNKVTPPDVKGDTSGFGAGPIFKDVDAVPAWMKAMAGWSWKIPDFGKKLQEVTDNLDRANLLDVLKRKFAEVPKAVAAMMKRPMTPVEKLAEDNRNRVFRLTSLGPKAEGAGAGWGGVLGRMLRNAEQPGADAELAARKGKRANIAPTPGGFATDPRSQRRAAAILKDRQQLEARRAAQNQRNFRGADYGGAGRLGALAGRGAAALGRLAGLGERATGLASGLASLAAGGSSGILGARQAAAGGRGEGRQGQPGRSTGRRTPFPWEMMGGGGPALQGFRSEFSDLAGFSKRLSADLLSTDKKKDEQLGVLQLIDKTLGDGESSVRGLLNKMANKPPGPGFAVGPA